MAPHSDVDLLFLTQAKPNPRVEKIIEDMLYILWDMRLKIGYSTRSINQCVQLGKTDQTIKTALLEHRYLCGHEDLYNKFGKQLKNNLLACLLAWETNKVASHITCMHLNTNQ